MKDSNRLGAYTLFSALTWMSVCILSRGFLGGEGFFYDLPNARMPFGRFFILYTISFGLYLLVVKNAGKLPANGRNVLMVLMGAFIFRLILIPSVPVHENDVYRYLWDGKVFTAGINPYKYAPVGASIKPAMADQQEDFEKLRSLRDEDPGNYRRISYKDVPTIYPPLPQVIFAVSTLLAPGSIYFMKFLFVLFDMAVVVLIYRVLKLEGLNPLYVVVYAWNPLVLKEIANSGHYDSLAICCVMAAMYFVLRKRYVFSSVCLGLGVLSKFYPLIFIPLFFKKNFKALITCLFVIAAGHLPFFGWGQTSPMDIFAGLAIYAKEWSLNGFLYELIYSSISIFKNDPMVLSKVLCGTMFMAIWVYIYQKKVGISEKAIWAVTALFFLSPVGAPWYYCWAIPFLCMNPEVSLIGLSYLLIFSYFEFTHDFGTLKMGKFQIAILLLMQYVPFYAALLLETRFVRKDGVTNTYGT